MTQNGEGWCWLAVKKRSALLKVTTSKYEGDFYCLNCLHYFWTKNRLYSHKTLRENIDFWSVAMRSEVTTIMGFNQYLKSDEIPSIIYADLEYFIKRIEQCKNKSEKASTKRNRWTYSLPVFSAYNMDIS